MLPIASKGSRFANQTCRNSGRPDYLGGLLGNTQQVWPPGARHDSAAPQDERSNLSLGLGARAPSCLRAPSLGEDPRPASPGARTLNRREPPISPGPRGAERLPPPVGRFTTSPACQPPAAEKLTKEPANGGEKGLPAQSGVRRGEEPVRLAAEKEGKRRDGWVTPQAPGSGKETEKESARGGVGTPLRFPSHTHAHLPLFPPYPAWKR